MAKFSVDDFKKGNLVVTSIVVLFLLSILYFAEWFKPAINSAQNSTFSFEFPDLRSSGQDEIEDVTLGQVLDQDSLQEIDSELEAMAPLDRVNYLLDQGYVEHLRDRSPNIEQTAFASGKVTSWSELRSKKVRRYLQEVSKSSLKISAQLDQDYYPKSKDALYNLSAALNSLIARKDSTRTANEVVSYLERLDMEVTDTMAAEGAPRDIFIQWSQVTLGPILSNSKSEINKKKKIPSFNPQFRLQFLEISKQKNRKSKFSPSIPNQIAFIASMRGSDVKSVTLYRDGVQVIKLPIHTDHRDKELKKVFYRHITASGLYSFVIEDKYGESYVKKYRFPASPVENNWRYVNSANFYVLNLPGNGRHSAIDSIYSVGNRANASNNWILASNLFQKPKNQYLVKF